MAGLTGLRIKLGHMAVRRSGGRKLACGQVMRMIAGAQKQRGGERASGAEGPANRTVCITPASPNTMIFHMAGPSTPRTSNPTPRQK